MRVLTEHIANPANDKLTVAVMDEPGSGGANHRYCVTTPGWSRAPEGTHTI